MPRRASDMMTKTGFSQDGDKRVFSIGFLNQFRREFCGAAFCGILFWFFWNVKQKSQNKISYSFAKIQSHKVLYFWKKIKFQWDFKIKHTNKAIFALVAEVLFTKKKRERRWRSVDGLLGPIVCRVLTIKKSVIVWKVCYRKRDLIFFVNS